MNILDLPNDIVLLIFPYLDARDFLLFTSCTPKLVHYRTYNPYWSALTRSTFRLPPQPVLQATAEENHWQKLYKVLRTQTRVYTWGNDAHGNLGHLGRKRMAARSTRMQRRSAGWPGMMKDLEDVGVISDVQCGGWSTVLLNDIGQLWGVGVLYGERLLHPTLALGTLKFPPAYPATDRKRYEPSTAIRQYSVGRHLLLGLADDAKIWEWVRLSQPAQIIKFFNLDVGPETNKVTRVIAGWSACSAYVQNVGIIYWTAQPDYVDADSDCADDALIVEHYLVPGTSYQPGGRYSDGDIAPSIGRVMVYVFLEHYIVFTTDNNKIYVWRAVEDALPGVYPRELTGFHRTKIQDLQGSFQRFGVFTEGGEVLLGDQELLDRIWDSPPDADPPLEAEPEVLPALQHADVISLAFGDHHFHALHANGTVTSYGQEPKGCGALGLGSRSLSPLRGVHFPNRPGGDGRLEYPSWSDGRRTVWFEEEKERWLSDTCQRGATSEARDRATLVASNPEVGGLMGEWFEREGQNWAEGPDHETFCPDETHRIPAYTGGYRVLKIAAAGWSSAALVLVDEERAESVRQKYILKGANTEEARPEGGEDREGQGDTGGLFQSLTNMGRSWLGWPEQSASDSIPDPVAASAREPTNAQQAPLNSRLGHASSSDQDTDIYVWDEQPYPRLRFPNGREMPGDVPFTELRGMDQDLSI